MPGAPLHDEAAQSLATVHWSPQPALYVHGRGDKTWPLPHAESRHLLSGMHGPMIFNPRMRPNLSCMYSSDDIPFDARRAGRVTSFLRAVSFALHKGQTTEQYLAIS